MKTQDEISGDILKITMLIQEKYPELSKYISEMPVTIPNDERPHINAQILQDYFESLDDLVKKYVQSHAQIG